jgi:hypothetical protein
VALNTINQIQEKAENNHPVGFDGFFKVFFLENI